MTELITSRFLLHTSLSLPRNHSTLLPL